VPPHQLRRRHRRQICSTLMLAARAERLAEPEQDQRAGQQRRHHTEQQKRGLALLASRTRTEHARTVAGSDRRNKTRAQQLRKAVVTGGAIERAPS
jgi:hypothetical protein